MKSQRAFVATVFLFAIQAGSRAESPSFPELPAEHALSAAGLAGAQIQAKGLKGIAPVALQCILGLKPDVFVPMVRKQLTISLTRDELAATESIYGGHLRDKIFVFGVAMVYRAHGLPSPTGEVTFTPEEDAELKQFVDTSAGRKLFKDRVLDTPAMTEIRQAATAQVFGACKSKGESNHAG